MLTIGGISGEGVGCVNTSTRFYTRYIYNTYIYILYNIYLYILITYYYSFYFNVIFFLLKCAWRFFQHFSCTSCT